MEYRRFDHTIVLRLDKGEELHEQIFALIRKENIRLATVTGIGATDDAVVGVYDVAAKKYTETHLYGENMEIVNLTGSINTMEGKPYDHIHITCAKVGAMPVGGHLLSARISLTAEIFITVIDGSVDRVYDPDMGINILKF